MEAKIIEVNGEYFIVHFENEGSSDFNKMRWSGTATQIQMFTDGTWKYQSNESSDFVDEFKNARVWFEWSFCWRGVWEGRIYFKDEEYWCEEMETIPLIWKEIEKIVKERIKSDNPEYGHFDDSMTEYEKREKELFAVVYSAMPNTVQSVVLPDYVREEIANQIMKALR